MQTIKCHCTRTRMARIQQTVPHAGKDVQHQEGLFINVGNGTDTATLEDSLAVSCKAKHSSLTM